MTEVDLATEHAREIGSGERFAFGENWSRFLKVLDDDRIGAAVDSLKDMLEVDSLDRKSFLDIGSGSGLFSLAARKLGARVTSFDYDPDSVACTRELKRRYFENDPDWDVRQGSVLDADYVQGLGSFDVVYSWGVLHHTGNMWAAMANAERSVAPRGLLFIALYNDQGAASRRWARVKKAYVSLPRALRWLVLVPAYARLWAGPVVRGALQGHPLRFWKDYDKGGRGMSPHRDVIDWVGGYPFEVAKPESVFDFYRKKGYRLIRLTTCAGGLGCNQYVFQKDA